MTDNTAFNLLDEKWILVLRNDGKVEAVSLKEALLSAHQIRRLANELATLDFALLRLLLAVLHGVFTRRDANGTAHEMESVDEATELWKSIWDPGQFPEKVILDYLEEHRDGFWLIHPTRPFYQIPGMDRSSDYDAPKLIGDISQSGNKLRLFCGREDRDSISFPEAARWVIYLQGYDDTSNKAKGKEDDGSKLPSPGAGYLGKLGMIALEGDNLFQTLMLNFALADGGGEPFPPGAPVWEKEVPETRERNLIPIPSSMAELFTIQSRRVALIVHEDRVKGYRLLGGDFYELENAFIEPMTIWKSSKSGQKEVWKPKRHDATKQFWRDFSVLVADHGRPPRILEWIERLRDEEIVDPFQTKVMIAGVAYGDKDFFVDGIISDTLSINADLLTKLGKGWQTRIVEVLIETETAVNALGKLASDLAIAMGDDPDKMKIAAVRKPARERAWYQLDEPFRSWLRGIRPDQNINDGIIVWKEKARGIIRALGDQMVQDVPDVALTGRYVTNNKVETLYCAPLAHRWFLYGKSGVMKALSLPTDGVEKKKENAEESHDAEGGKP